MFEGPPMNPCARALALLCRNKMGQTFAQSGPYAHCSCIKSVLYSLFNARKMCNNEISMQNDAKDARSVFLRFASDYAAVPHCCSALDIFFLALTLWLSLFRSVGYILCACDLFDDGAFAIYPDISTISHISVLGLFFICT